MRSGLLWVVVGAGSLVASASGQDRIGLAALQARLGAATPDGTGVTVMQVEADADSAAPRAYLPNSASFPGKVFTDKSGGGVASGHATTVGDFLYGPLSPAPGVTDIDAYEAVSVNGMSLSLGNWFTTGYLNLGGGSTTPDPLGTESRNVMCGAFVLQFTTGMTELSDSNAQTLRRLDWSVHNRGMVAVVGIRNDTFDWNPSGVALGQAYNTITVGSDPQLRQTSRGPTDYAFEQIGRSKPDLVGLSNASSWSTGSVAGAVALLRDGAGRLFSGGVLTSARRPETLKALLLAGCVKNFDTVTPPPPVYTWTRVTSTVNSVTFREPLDRRTGAGMINVNNSHRILEAGETEAEVHERTTGWDFHASLAVNSNRTYFFTIPALHFAEQYTAALVWHRLVTIGMAGATAVVPNLNLELHTASGLFLVSKLDESVSPVDNVEYLYETGLWLTGRYALRVVHPAGSPAASGYGLAWDMPVYPMGDVNRSGTVSASDVSSVVGAYGQTAPGKKDQDFSNDENVSAWDLAVTLANFAP